MSTNYYAIKGADAPGIKEDLLKAVKRQDWEEAQDLLNQVRGEWIHLGKRSSGWVFCWDHNHKAYYNTTRQSIDRFLRRPDVRIEDEYGRGLSPDDLWEIHDASLDGKDDRQYLKEDPDAMSEPHDYWMDGLRFHESTDFC